MKRNLAIDALRGLMLVIMTIDHFGGALAEFTNESFGFVSAAGGFVFLSGLVAGLVYGRLVKGDMYSLRSRTSHRAMVIYLAHILIVLLFLAQVFTMPASAGLAKYQYLRTNPVEALLLAFCFLYQPASLGILPMYVAFMFLLPYVLRKYEEGGAGVVLMGSGLLWFFAQLGVQEDIVGFVRQYVPMELGNFDVLAWQVFFVFGSWIGYTIVFKKSVQVEYNRILLVVACVLLVALYLLRHFDVGRIELSSLFNFEAATSRKHLGWLRLFNFAVIAYLVSWLMRTHEGIFKRLKWLVYLGQHSLAVFWYHFLGIAVLRSVELRTSLRWGKLHLVLTILLVFSLSIAAMVHGQFISIRRRRATSFVPT